MLMMFLGIIGKRYKDAGLKDVLVQSEVIAEGSVDKAYSMVKCTIVQLDVTKLYMKLFIDYS